MNINNGKPLEVLNVDDGRYLCKLVPLSREKSSREWREYYFVLVSEVCSYTGDKKLYIHNQFKESQGVGTTKSFNSEDWNLFVEKFKFWVYNNLDIIL
jgi:hypothetical protein